MKKDELKIFSGSSNLSLAKEIASEIGTELGNIELRKFSDGESSVKILDNVRGSDVFIIQSTCAPSHENIVELLLINDALKRASTQNINNVIPYYGYARQDRKVDPRVPISAKVIAKLLESVSINRVLTMDLHSDQIQGFFDIPVDHLFAAPLLIKYLREMPLQNLVVVSPDSGGANRARFFAKKLDTDLAIIDKRREKSNESEVMNIIGEIKEKDCLIIDDMIDTAGTICKAAVALKEKGARKIYAAATHGVLSGPALGRLKNSPFEEIILTNTISIPENNKLSNMKILSVASIIGEAIKRIHKKESVSSLFI